jgi:alanine dehydrogenase
MKECIEAMADAFRALAIGEARLPLRQVIPLPNSPNLLAVMPGQLGSVTRERHRSSIGAKVITVFPGNDATPLDSHLGVVLLFEADTGTLLAIIDASSVTAIRTAAVSGLATRLLSNPGAGDLAILGGGVQAMTHLDAMRSVRPLRRVRIWSRSPERRARFVEKARQQFGISVEPSPSVELCVEGADIINAVGAALAIARELDSAAVTRSRLYVDRRESALAEAGDILIPMSEGAFNADHIRGEIGEVLLGVVPARESPDEITLFKSLGLAIEDLAAARVIYEKGVALGTGVWVSLGGLREQ